jgi:4-amino-4-deoxy-L-arabinose transferase-like glycosyltransferase
MTLAVHAFLAALERIRNGESALLPCLAFAAVTALNLLTKGLIGLVFPLGFVFLYLAFTRQLRLLLKLQLIPSVLLFLAIGAPWHILAAVRNPAISLPPGLGLPARGGWAWFYLYNEHIARFLSKRIPHDYGQVPIPLFWALAAIWLFPWIAFLPAAIAQHIRDLRTPESSSDRQREAALTVFVWSAVVMVFFTLSARQEYYSLPALPALALMAGGLLGRVDQRSGDAPQLRTSQSVLRWHKWLLMPVGAFSAGGALFFAVFSPRPKPGTDISTLLAQGGDYNLSLSHLFDLTGAAMGLFRGPLVLFGLSMAAIGPLTYLLRRRRQTFAANLALAGAAVCMLLAVHSGLTRFYPTLGSRPLADAILRDQASRAAHGSAPQTCTVDNATCSESADLVVLDGELTSGSTLLFYTREPLHLVNGRVNGPWYGSFWPDAPHVFETNDSLRQLWASPRRVYLLTYHADERLPELTRFGAVHVLASSGGKSILTN